MAAQMPRFFFDIGPDDQDPDGVVLQDHKAARSEAIRAAAEFLRDAGPQFGNSDWMMHVRDERGGAVLEILFSVTEKRFDCKP